MKKQDNISKDKIDWREQLKDYVLKEKLIRQIENKMVRGHDDFYDFYCIHIEDWIKLKEGEKK